MIQNLLDSDRIHAGEKLSLTPSDCDLLTITNEVVENMTAIYGARFVVVGENIIGRWDKKYLTRTIENLISNAVKYGDADKPITLTLTETANSASLAVHNVGLAIPKEHQADLFNQYWRMESAKNSGKMGWGLGLTIVRGVAEAHGGRVEVISPTDNGTVFKITIPKTTMT